MPRGTELAGPAIAHDLADERSRAALVTSPDDGHTHQAAFRRIASTLHGDHPLSRYLPASEREAMKTTAMALCRLVRHRHRQGYRGAARVECAQGT